MLHQTQVSRVAAVYDEFLARFPTPGAMAAAGPGAVITAQTVAALSRHGPVAQAFIADRVSYPMATTSGQTAPELAPRGPAAAEVAALWTEVKAFLNESSKARTVRHG